MLQIAVRVGDTASSYERSVPEFRDVKLVIRLNLRCAEGGFNAEALRCRADWRVGGEVVEARRASDNIEPEEDMR